MSGERFVLAGLARARSAWFRTLASWATSGAIPATFLGCVSAEELRAHLSSGRRLSAVLLDAGLPVTDRDLLAAVREAGAVPLVVEAAGVDRDWGQLGAPAVLPTGFSRGQLLDALGTHAAVVEAGDALPSEGGGDDASASGLAPTAVVCGSGGTGASTVAIALAQGLARSASLSGPVVLADLCLRAEQAALHDARDVVPGIQELVEAHRGRRPRADEVQAHTFRVVERGYHLLLGLRRARYWAAVRPRAFEAALSSLRAAFATVVCDVTADFEDETHGGSADVEERTSMARTALGHASVVLAVGTPDMKGMHSLARLLVDLADAGAADAQVLPIVNRAPRSPRARAQLARALSDLSGPSEHPGPVFLPRRRVDEALRDGVALPDPLPALVAGGYAAVLARVGAEEPAGLRLPERVRPGQLGAWAAAGE